MHSRQCKADRLGQCSSRKGTVDAASSLAEKATRSGGGSIYVVDRAQYEQLEAAANAAKHKQLAQALRAGVGFHYAAMEPEDRSSVEHLFLNRALLVSLPNLRTYVSHDEFGKRMELMC